MLCRAYSAALCGLDAKLVEVEVSSAHGMRAFNIVGLPDKAVQEAQQRVIAAIKSARFPLAKNTPVYKRVLVNLAPADLRKEGAAFDLAIAVALLATGQLLQFDSKRVLLAGELALSGQLRPIPGALSIAQLASKLGFAQLLLPKANAAQAALVEGLAVYGLESLTQAAAFLKGNLALSPQVRQTATVITNYELDFSDIGGQQTAKRALEIAAAGSHNLLMIGPPGSGKSLLAKALPSILPPLQESEQLELTKIYSASGLLKSTQVLIQTRPFRAPHHSSSQSAVIGGGNPLRAGEITLAHRGVLFLDELPEFHRDVLEALRQPLEDGQITVSRAKERQLFPASFQLIAAANPCPCGYLGSEQKPCVCNGSQLGKYQRKLSGPLIDRIDMVINVPAQTYQQLEQGLAAESSAQILKRVSAARHLAGKRLAKVGLLNNAELNVKQLKTYCRVDKPSEQLLAGLLDRGQLSARGYHRILKVSRTIADLNQQAQINHEHVSEALAYKLAG